MLTFTLKTGENPESNREAWRKNKQSKKRAEKRKRGERNKGKEEEVKTEK
jgi:hypothetical protein